MNCTSFHIGSSAKNFCLFKSFTYCAALQISVFRMASDFFIQTLQGWSGPMGWEAEIGLIKVSFYYSKSKHFYGILLWNRSPVKIFSAKLDCFRLSRTHGADANYSI